MWAIVRHLIARRRLQTPSLGFRKKVPRLPASTPRAVSQTSKFELYCCTHDGNRHGATHFEIAKSATARISEPTKLKQTVRDQRGKARSVAGSRRPADYHTGCPLNFTQPRSQPAARDLARGKIASLFNGSVRNVLVGGAAPAPTLLLRGGAIATLTVEAA